VLAMLLITNNTLTDSIFIAFQEAKYIFVVDLFLGLIRVCLPIALVGLGAYGLFAAHASAVVIAAVLSLAIISRRYNYRFRPDIDRTILRQVAAYSTGTYLASLSEALPFMMLPIMVTNLLGARPAAYFYSAMTVANLLFIIPRATANSLLAESSKRGTIPRKRLFTTLRHTATILVPAILGIAVLGNVLLRVFGPDYALGGFTLLRLFGLSALILATNVITAVRYKIARNVRRLIIAQVTGTVTMFVLFTPLASRFGLTGVGLAWLAGQIAITIVLVSGLPSLGKGRPTEVLSGPCHHLKLPSAATSGILPLPTMCNYR